MRFLAALLLSFVLGACASGSGGLQHPRVSPDSGEASEDAPPPPPEEGSDFAVFRGDGTPAAFQDIIAEARESEVVLFGEEHDDLMTHRLQAEVLRRLFVDYNRPSASGRPSPHPGRTGVATPQTGGDRTVVLSLEMFERDVQYVLDEYLADLISEDHFTASARAWDRYDTDYRAAVEFAKAHGMPVVAANAPRRYVNRASRLGSASLSELPASARAYLPPLPHPTPSAAYEEEWLEIMGEGAEYMSGSPIDGQALWDATMAHSIQEALEREENPLVLHLAGSFHVANFTGIPEVLEAYRPGTRQLVLVARPVESLDGLPEEYHGEGDFVIVTRGEG
ncbi:MAG: ChaN family lipoprotein [Gemmatimonadales bacterium]|nr:MAG: ChaN family lipoprotein [Gemmatimonadales bacterium]